MTDNAETLLRFSEKLADIARALLLEAAQDAPSIEFKQDASFVTATDRAVEARLREKIRAAYPGHGIVGEEHGSEASDAEFVWVLDPIDGTAAWIAGIPVYGSLIAVAQAGRPLTGVIDLPATRERLTGIAAQGAWHNGAPIRCRKNTALADAFMTSSNPRFVPQADRAPFARLDAAVNFTQYGGSCYAYGCLARGRTDLAVDAGFDTYDLFAPAAIISGAGGIVTDWAGAPLDLAWQGRVIAAGDAALHRQALDVLSGG
jgi:inositol-phosphate phosphatase / L-galactose 1-phosphate phosphatase / histidinol-phosphatase